MAETFAEFQARVLGYLGTRDPIRVKRATPAALERRIRRLAPAVATRRPAPAKWSIAEIVTLEAAHDLNHLRQIDRILAQASGRRAAARRSAT